jgi:cellobiose-specific phosphotransferase system component IIA
MAAEGQDPTVASSSDDSDDEFRSSLAHAQDTLMLTAKSVATLSWGRSGSKHSTQRFKWC